MGGRTNRSLRLTSGRMCPFPGPWPDLNGSITTQAGSHQAATHATILVMANDKNNINELVAEDDDDPTSELETLTIQHMALADLPDSESEVGAQTSHKPSDDLPPDLPDVADAEAPTHASETINRLQFDIEQLRAKWLGLETEIQAREEISDNLIRELKRNKKELAQVKSQLDERDATVANLETALQQRDDELQTTRDDGESARALYDELHLQFSELEQQLAGARTEIDSLNAALEEAHTAEDRAREHGSAADAEIASLREEQRQAQKQIAKLEENLTDRESRWQALHDEYEAQQTALSRATADLDMSRARIEQRGHELESLSKRVAERDETVRELQGELQILQQKLDEFTDDENERNRRLVSEQAGQIASDAVLISDLRAHIERVEHYADSLRVQLQERIAASDDGEVRFAALSADLSGARAEIDSLIADLEAERQHRADLERSLQDVDDRHADEIRTLRFELGEAQDTARQHEQVSLQLAADLGDNQAKRARLDEELAKHEASHQAELDELRTEVDRQKTQILELEEELAAKSEAAHALVEELSKKSRQLESIGKIEDVIQDIDSRMSERIEERPNGERVTRLLVGNLDGQEVRYPLFKNRLTIGRTRQNDIQLKAAYVSRRHAVVLSDGDTVRIVDWGSKNGVFVNSARVSEYLLQNGDVVTIGTADFRYEARPKRDR